MLLAITLGYNPFAIFCHVKKYFGIIEKLTLDILPWVICWNFRISLGTIKFKGMNFSGKVNFPERKHSKKNQFVQTKWIISVLVFPIKILYFSQNEPYKSQNSWSWLFQILYNREGDTTLSSFWNFYLFELIFFIY